MIFQITCFILLVYILQLHCFHSETTHVVVFVALLERVHVLLTGSDFCWVLLQTLHKVNVKAFAWVHLVLSSEVLALGVLGWWLLGSSLLLAWSLLFLTISHELMAECNSSSDSSSSQQHRSKSRSSVVMSPMTMVSPSSMMSPWAVAVSSGEELSSGSVASSCHLISVEIFD